MTDARRIHVETPGLLTSVQDMGRHGHSSSGVGAAGAADKPALHLGNALVGNVAEAAGIECTLAGPRLSFETDAEIAITGAPFKCTIDNEAIPVWTPVHINAGSRLHIAGATFGCRCYVAIGGGIHTVPVLGSRSEDLNSAIGPFDGRPLQADDILPLGPAPPRSQSSNWALSAACWRQDQRPLTLPLMPATHTDELDRASRNALFENAFRIGADSNRVACRLEGNNLNLGTPLELMSEGVLPGTVQLPPSGVPIAMLVEAPVTGGYPRIGHISALDLTRLAQLQPGDEIRFYPESVHSARTRHIAREHELQQLVCMIQKRRAGQWP